MPPRSVHFNGSVNLEDTATVMREIAARVPGGFAQLPDGETGDRQNWIFFQLRKFWETPGLESVPVDGPALEYRTPPKVRLVPGADPSDVRWPDLGYARAYQTSFEVFSALRTDDVLPPDVRFQAQYPTPLASISNWVAEPDQARLEPSYTAALFADLARFLAAVPHDSVAVQWDVAIEFGVLEGSFPQDGSLTLDTVAERLGRCVGQVPDDVPVGLHLCYGDLGHQHFRDPDSLALQVRVANAVTERAARPIDRFAFTVPQHQRDRAFFEPLRDLRVAPSAELMFALVPYHPDTQPAGTTDVQARLIDEFLGADAVWGICTECGMGRVERSEIPSLLDLHREILARHPG